MNWVIMVARVAMCATMVYVLRRVTTRVAPIERDLTISLSDWLARNNHLSLIWGLPAMVIIGLSDDNLWGPDPAQPWAELRNLQLATKSRDRQSVRKARRDRLSEVNVLFAVLCS
jgi:hypothetical protein